MKKIFNEKSDQNSANYPKTQEIMFSLMDVINLILSIKNVIDFYQLVKKIYQSKKERN